MTTAVAGQRGSVNGPVHGLGARGVRNLRALWFLVKGSSAREILGQPFRALLKHIALPAGVVCFFTFLHVDATARGGWPMLAVAGAIWLLFANSVSHGGMMLWHERWLLRDARVPASLLLTSAALVPVALFGIHISLIHLALRILSVPQEGTLIELVLAGGIAVATGLGLGILAARLSGFRPNFVSVLSKLLLASLILTPVFYRLSSLEGVGQAWCTVNPLCAATELARAGLSLERPPIPGHAKIIACSVSASILCWGLFTMGLPSTAFAAEHD
jgi:ABC-type polysaccharide/polyol phosphate export permease